MGRLLLSPLGEYGVGGFLIWSTRNRHPPTPYSPSCEKQCWYSDIFRRQ